MSGCAVPEYAKCWNYAVVLGLGRRAAFSRFGEIRKRNVTVYYPGAPCDGMVFSRYTRRGPLPLDGRLVQPLGVSCIGRPGDQCMKPPGAGPGDQAAPAHDQPPSLVTGAWGKYSPAFLLSAMMQGKTFEVEGLEKYESLKSAKEQQFHR